MPGGSDLSEGCREEENSHQFHLQGVRECRTSSLAVAFVFGKFHVLPRCFTSALHPAGE